MIQSIARVFDPQAAGRDRSSIRLRVVPTEGSVQSAVTMEAGQADLAVIRGDLKLPKDAQAVATLRKNVVAIWVPTPPEAKGAKGKKGAAAKGAKSEKIEKIADLAGRKVGVIGRSQSNVNLLRLILQQYGVPADKVEIVQFAPAEVNEAIRGNKADAFIAVGPGQQPDHHRCDRSDGARRRRADLPADRSRRLDRKQISGLRRHRDRRRRVRRRARRGRRRASRRSASAPHRRAQIAVGQRQSRPSRASCSRCARR